MDDNLFVKFKSKAAKDSLKAMENISGAAQDELNKNDDAKVSAFASVNTFTDQSFQRSLRVINEENRRTLENLSREPFLSRVRYLDDDKNEHIIFVTRFGTLTGCNCTLVSRNAPIGRLASLHPGDSQVVKIQGEDQELVLLEKLQVREILKEALWDSVNNTFSLEDQESDQFGSLRQFIFTKEHIVEDGLFGDPEAVEADEYRRQYLTQFELQDQPILDKFQDEIFRLPLSSRYFLSGPPGTGKTTTLVRRLAQKLDLTVAALNNDDSAINRSMAGTSQFKKSWIMFSPTALLKQWVKEAFGKEDIPATDERILTWEDYRRNLARGTLRILTTAQNTGFVMKESLSHINADTENYRQIDWFEDYYAFQSDSFWTRLKENAEWLVNCDQVDLQKIGKNCALDLESYTSKSLTVALVNIEQRRETIENAYTKRSEEIDKKIENHIRLLANQDMNFINDLRSELRRIETVLNPAIDDDIDEEELDVDDPDTNTRFAATRKINPAVVLRSALKSHIGSILNNRKVKRGSRNALVIEWLGVDRMPPEKTTEDVGTLLIERKKLAPFRLVLTKYLRNTRTLYRSFRRIRTNENKWYINTPKNGREVHPIELDLIILSIVVAVNEIIAAAPGDVISNVTETSLIRLVMSEMKAQIMIDEATDFSPLQLASMYYISDPSTRSVFLSGDFNQRLTSIGVKSYEELAWAIPDIEERPIAVSYRQSKILMDFGQKIIEIDGGIAPKISQPAGVDIQSIPPVLCEKLDLLQDKARWVGDRIKEIDAIVGERVFPSIAVLVNDDETGSKLEKYLSTELEDINLRAKACLDGQALGSGNDVRIYDRKYIKGLEFEAVFFLDVDRLAEKEEDLFMKYLYVGASRARTFLGMIFSGELPNSLEGLRKLFILGWNS